MTGSRCRRSDPACARFGFTRTWNTACFYVATLADAVYVLHAFEKRTRKTPKRDLDLAGDRFRALVRERQADAKQK